MPGDSETIGVSTCECYANSFTDPFDECQGDELCMSAMCMEDACGALSVSCNEGVCVLDEIDTTAVVELNPCAQGQCLSPEGLCEIEASCFVDPCDVTDECTGECQANYCGGCHAVCLEGPETTESIDNAIVRPSVTSATPESLYYTWDGPRCNSDDDCFVKTRERVPGESEVIGVSACQCYASSLINPLDECQGESDMTCPIAGCMENPCRNAMAFCLEDTGVCYLDTSIEEPPVAIAPTSTIASDTPMSIFPDEAPVINYTWSPICSSDDDCFTSMRQYEPGDSETIGVGVCQCYANSYKEKLDECQADEVCIAAMCMTFSCEGLSAYCNTVNGICELSDSLDFLGDNNTNSIATIVTDATSMATLTADTDIVIDETASNEFFTDATEPATSTDKPVTTSEAVVVTADTVATNEAVDKTTSTLATESSAVTSSTAFDDKTTSTTDGTMSSTSDTTNASPTATVSIVETIEGETEESQESDEIFLQTSSTVTTTTPNELGSNPTFSFDYDRNETTTETSLTPTSAPEDPTLSENNEVESYSNDVAKSQEGLPLDPSGSTSSTFGALSIFILVAIATILLSN